MLPRLLPPWPRLDDRAQQAHCPRNGSQGKPGTGPVARRKGVHRCRAGANGVGRRQAPSMGCGGRNPRECGRNSARSPSGLVRRSARRSSMSITATMPDVSAIAENLRRVRERIANAAIKAGRKPEAVTLVAVSKTKPVEAVRAAVEAGQTVFGENRVQEAAGKFPSLRSDHRFQLHIIGGLQTNKARDAVKIAEVIETLDRPRLADAIADAMAKEGRTPTLLVEVNTGDEAQKSGVARAEADSF